MASNNPILSNQHSSDSTSLQPSDMETEPVVTTGNTTVAAKPDLEATNSLNLDRDFHPTHCFFVGRHWGVTQRIPIYDISSDVELASYPLVDNKKTAPWFEEASARGQQRAQSDTKSEKYAIHRANWYGNNFTMRSGGNEDGNDDSGKLLVDWKGGWHSGRKNRLIFPADSPHSSHEVTVKADNYVKFRDVFVLNSCKYEWHCLNRLSMRQFRCDMVLAGGQTRTVARMWRSRNANDWFAQGGVILVETGELDEVVALCTAMVVQRQTRQKSYEYSN